MVHFQRPYHTMTMHCDGFALQVTHAVILAALLIFGQEILSLCAGKPCLVLAPALSPPVQLLNTYTEFWAKYLNRKGLML